MARKKAAGEGPAPRAKTKAAKPGSRDRAALPWSPPGLFLAPEDAASVTYRERVPVVRGAAPPFDLEACLERMRKAGEYWIWHRCKIERDLSPEEAHFWFEAISRCEGSELSYDAHAAALRKLTFDGEVTRKAVEARVVAKPWYLDLLVRPVAVLLGLRESLELHASRAVEVATRSHSDTRWLAALNLHQDVFPCLTSADRDALRASIDKRLLPAAWDDRGGHNGVPAWTIAAALGLHARVRALVASWKPPSERPDQLQIAEVPAQHLILGLPSQAEVEAERRRLEQWLYRPELLRAWLAHTGFDALDVVQESIQRITRKGDAEAMVEALAEVTTAPEVAPVMRTLAAEPRTAKPARRWLDAQG